MFGSIERALIQVSYAETNKRLRKPYFSTDCLFVFFFYLTLCVSTEQLYVPTCGISGQYAGS